MKIALTGSSSTGKTTLAQNLLTDPKLNHLFSKTLNVDARKLISEMGYRNIQAMTQDELRNFQIIYYNRKVELESDEYSFIAERSFVDVAAYWLERDSKCISVKERELLVSLCEEKSRLYDAHVYLPFGVIAFEKDGHRPSDMDIHIRVDQQIRHLLKKWNLEYIELPFEGVKRRVQTICSWLLDTMIKKVERNTYRDDV